MLPCAASQAFARRGASLAARRTALSSSQWSRSYARDNKDSPSSRIDIRKSLQDVSNRGPVKNRTWSPDVGVKFATDGPQYSSTSKPPSPVEPSPAEAKIPEPTATAQPTPPNNVPRRSSKLGGAAATTDYSGTQAAQTKIGSDAGEESAKTPLPDLTQGIPSTFESEFLNKNKATAHDGQDSPQSALDITESQATEGGDGGRRGGRGTGGEGGRRQKEEYVSSIERRRNAMMRYTMIGGAAFAVVGAFFLGQNWADAEEEEKHSDAPNGYTPGAFYGRIKARLNETFGYYTEPAFPKLLPTMDPSMSAPYTLVMSLEDLLVSSKWTPQKGWQVAKRPGMDYFLRYLSQYYELVLFTSVASMNADMVLKKLDPFQIIAFPLFREATRYINGEHVKDLSYLNRDLSKTLIIDTVAAHTQLQPENAVILPKWSGDPKDEHTSDLVALIPFLEYIATMGIQDVRAVLKSYEGTHIPTEFARREAKAREAFNKQLEEEKRKRGKLGSLTGGLSSILGFKPSTGLMQVPGEPSLADGLAQGKMLSDQMRERGQRNYLAIDKEIRENGERWIKEREAEEKKMIEETTKSMQGNVRGTFGGLFGGGGNSNAADKQ